MLNSRAALVAAALVFSAQPITQNNRVDITSPNGHLRFRMWVDESAVLRYSIALDDHPVVEPSAAGIVVAVRLEHGEIRRGDPLTIDLRSGGGFVARLTPRKAGS